MSVFEFEAGGLIVTMAVPTSVSKEEFLAVIGRRNGAQPAAGKAPNVPAPVPKSTGALLAQGGAPVTPGLPKGTGTGADAAPVRRMTGAPLAPVPLGGPVSSAPEHRLEFYRNEVKALTAERLTLAPDFDMHEDVVRNSRAALVASFRSHEVFATEDVKAHRDKHYARLLDAGVKWGRQTIRYKQVKAMIENLTREIDAIVARKVAA